MDVSVLLGLRRACKKTVIFVASMLRDDYQDDSSFVGKECDHNRNVQGSYAMVD